MLSLRPRPRLILTTDTDTALDTLDTILDTLDTVDTMDSDTMVVSDTTARGLLMLRPIPTLSTVDSDTPDTAMESMDMDTDSDLDTDSDTAIDTCTARGLLMLSLGLRPIPTLSTVDSDTPVISDTDTDSDTAPDTTMASRLHQDLSVNQR